MHGGPFGSSGREGPSTHASAAVRFLLAVVVPLAALAGLLASHAWVPGPGLIYDLRLSLHDAAGVLFFGAGLLHLSADRLAGGPPGRPVRAHSHGRTGLVLLLLGVLLPRMSALGPALHRETSEAILSPWTATLVAFVVLAADVAVEHAAPARPRRTGSLAGSWLAVAGAAVLLLLLVAPLLAHRSGIAVPSLPGPLHVCLELAVAALWLARAAHVRRRVGHSTDRPVEQGLPASLLAALSLTWTVRAAAVVDLSWSIAAAALLTMTGLIVFAAALRSFARVTTVREEHFARAEEALRAAEHALTELDAQRGSLRHDARNSMFALRAAAQVLLDHGDHLDAATQTRLRRAMAQELTDLESLLALALPRIPGQSSAIVGLARVTA